MFLNRAKCMVCAGLVLLAPGVRADHVFLAGACAFDVTPTNLPVIINGGFLSQTANAVHSRLHVRWLVLDDGRTRVALGVLDSCLIPREFADAVKARAQALTSIPEERIMLSATHTHSAPSLMRALGTDADPHYAAFALPRIAEGFRRAVENLRPARVGWTVAQAPNHTHTRVWIRRPDKMLTDPFGELTVRANMHPGYQNPEVVGPSGPSDPELTLLAVESPDGQPIAVLANYSMHYFGAQAVSADYYGLFAEKLGALIGAGPGSSRSQEAAAAHFEESKIQSPRSKINPPFVAIMSQGTSGDQHWMDYSGPKRDLTIAVYADELAQIAANAYKTITFHSWVPLTMRGQTLQIATRQPDVQRLAWARDVVEKLGERPPKSLPEVYALEQLWLKQNPIRDVRLQALRVGNFGIAIWPCEVFALSGLKVKAQSPLQPTMNIELANAEEGYIPPPELHPLGGYNTWSCRTAGLDSNAEPKMVEALLGLLERVSGQSRRRVITSRGTYSRAVLTAKPLAYWRLEEWSGPTAFDSTAAHRHAIYEPGVARWLEGPQSAAFSGAEAINRCPHFAGGRLLATLKPLKPTYSCEFWFWNGLPNDLRPVTGYLFARGGETLALGGTNCAPGKLLFGSLVGRTTIAPRTWNHVVLVRDTSRVAVYLNGNTEPDIDGEAAPERSPELFFSGRGDKEATLEGRIDEVAIYNRALSSEEICRHYQFANVRAKLSASTE